MGGGIRGSGTTHQIGYFIFDRSCTVGMFETSREGEVGVSLYCRKVLIKSKAENLLPKWLRKNAKKVHSFRSIIKYRHPLNSVT